MAILINLSHGVPLSTQFVPLAYLFASCVYPEFDRHSQYLRELALNRA